MKSYTDIEQSKKLAEILPIKSADMHYATWTILDGEFIVFPNQGSTIEDLQEDYGNQIIPCWSLAALLEKIPNTVVNDAGEDLKLHIDKYTLHYSLSYENVYTGYKFEIETDMYENLVDACVEMILKLKENNNLL